MFYHFQLLCGQLLLTSALGRDKALCPDGVQLLVHRAGHRIRCDDIGALVDELHVPHHGLYTQAMVTASFVSALQQSQAWCGPRVDPQRPTDCLRSAALRPPNYPDFWTYGDLYPNLIQDLVTRRQALLALNPLASNHQPGRILAVLQNADTSMGEGTPASGGFIDDVYLPPWDTWFAYLPLTTGMLLAWIPEVFEAAVERAQEVAATEPLAWLNVALQDTRVPRTFGDPGWAGVARELRTLPELVTLLTYC